jgi:large subunit ribosomal protein L9
MRVVLLADVENLGKKNEVKEVKDGFARNFLLPKGLAKIATKEALRELDLRQEIEEKSADEELKKIQALASSIDGQEVTISVRVGENDQLFGSVGPQKIYEEMKKAGFNIKKKQIELPEPIKNLGEFPVKIKFEHNLEAEITVIVIENK